MTSYNLTTPALPINIQPVYISSRVAPAADHPASRPVAPDAPPRRWQDQTTISSATADQNVTGGSTTVTIEVSTTADEAAADG